MAQHGTNGGRASRRKTELFYPPRTLREALYGLGHRSSLSVEQQAELLGISASYLYNAVNPNLDTDGPFYQLRHLVSHTKLTNNFAVVDFIEAQLGRVAFSLPPVSGSSAPASTQRGEPVTAKCVLQLTKEFADAAQAFHAALANDDEIDGEEVPRCRQELYELLQKGAELFARLDQREG